MGVQEEDGEWESTSRLCIYMHVCAGEYVHLLPIWMYVCLGVGFVCGLRMCAGGYVCE